MKQKDKSKVLKSKRVISSIILYIAASVVSLVAVIMLINNIMLFNTTASGYVAQGYAAKDVLEQLIPSQLIPGIFQPVAVYGGVAFILFGIGIINQKVSRCLLLLTNDKIEKSVSIEDLQTENINEIGNNELVE